MSRANLECWTDPLRLLPLGGNRGLPDINPARARGKLFDEHLRRVIRRPTGPTAGDRAAAEPAPSSATGQSDRGEDVARPSCPAEAEPDTPATQPPEPEDTDQPDSQPGADSDEDKNVQEPAATEGKTDSEEEQADAETDGDNEHAAAEAGASKPVVADNVTVDQVSPETKQEASDGEGARPPGRSEPEQQSQKTTQPAKLAPDQPAPQQPSKADAVPEGDASADAETKATARQADCQPDDQDAAVSKETPGTPDQPHGAAEVATVTSSPRSDADPSGPPETRAGRGRKEKVKRQAQQAGPNGNRAAVDATPEPTFATASSAARPAPAARPEQIFTDVTSAEGGEENPGTQGTTGPTTSGTSWQNETGGPVRAATGQGSPRALATPGQRQPAGGDVERVRFVQRVARAFQAVGSDGGSVRLRLRPPNLGSLRLELSVRNGAMTARLEVETTAARNTLLDNLPALRDRLAQQDIKIERFDIDLAEDPSGGLPQQPGENPQPGQRPARNAPPPEDRPNVETEDVSRPAPVMRAGEGSQLNVIV